MALFPVLYLAAELFLYIILVLIIESVINNENFMRFWTSEA